MVVGWFHCSNLRERPINKITALNFSISWFVSTVDRIELAMSWTVCARQLILLSIEILDCDNSMTNWPTSVELFSALSHVTESNLSSIFHSINTEATQGAILAHMCSPSSFTKISSPAIRRTASTNCLKLSLSTMIQDQLFLQFPPRHRQHW